MDFDAFHGVSSATGPPRLFVPINRAGEAEPEGSELLRGEGTQECSWYEEGWGDAGERCGDVLGVASVW